VADLVIISYNYHVLKTADVAKQGSDLLLTIFELVKNGANPTIKSTSGQQPKHIALIIGFELEVLLLGKTSAKTDFIFSFAFVL